MCESNQKKPESTWKERPAAKDMELHNWVAFPSPSTSSTLHQRSRPVRQMPLALSSAVSPACLAQHSEVDGKTGRGGRRVPACLCLSMPCSFHLNSLNSLPGLHSTNQRQVDGQVWAALAFFPRYTAFIRLSGGYQYAASILISASRSRP